VALAAVGVVALLVVVATPSGALRRATIGRAGPPAQYVALGDSYASGPVIAPQLVDPAGCLRSARDYPHLVAQALGLALTDATCGGATTADMTGSQTITGGQYGPQIDAVGPRTAVVTLTVGGDDLGFSDLIKNCLALTPFGPTSVGLTCRDHYDPGGHDQLTTLLDGAASRLSTTLERIHQVAPRARVFVVGYPAILPATGDGCWPVMPFTLTDADYLRSTELSLNAMLAQVAGANRAAYVDTYTPSESHNACQSAGQRWIEPVIPTQPAAPVHPNAAGEAGLAAIVAQAIRSDTVL
jgi:hypothetical protein